MDEAIYIALLNKQERSMKDFITGANTLQNARMINRIDPIETKLDEIIQQNAVRNGRMESAEDDIIELQSHVESSERVFCWIKNRWYVILIALMLLSMVSAWGYHNINLKRTIENKSGVYFKDSTTDTAERGPVE